MHASSCRGRWEWPAPHARSRSAGSVWTSCCTRRTTTRPARSVPSSAWPATACVRSTRSASCRRCRRPGSRWPGSGCGPARDDCWGMSPRGRRAGDPLLSVTLMRADLVAASACCCRGGGGAALSPVSVARPAIRATIDAELIVGADGIWSITRRAMDAHRHPNPVYAGIVPSPASLRSPPRAWAGLRTRLVQHDLRQARRVPLPAGAPTAPCGGPRRCAAATGRPATADLRPLGRPVRRRAACRVDHPRQPGLADVHRQPRAGRGSAAA